VTRPRATSSRQARRSRTSSSPDRHRRRPGPSARRGPSAVRGISGAASSGRFDHSCLPTLRSRTNGDATSDGQQLLEQFVFACWGPSCRTSCQRLCPGQVGQLPCSLLTRRLCTPPRSRATSRPVRRPQDRPRGAHHHRAGRRRDPHRSRADRPAPPSPIAREKRRLDGDLAHGGRPRSRSRWNTSSPVAFRSGAARPLASRCIRTPTCG